MLSAISTSILASLGDAIRDVAEADTFGLDAFAGFDPIQLEVFGR
jgi:hypothetical protein